MYLIFEKLRKPLFSFVHGSIKKINIYLNINFQNEMIKSSIFEFNSHIFLNFYLTQIFKQTNAYTFHVEGYYYYLTKCCESMLKI